MKSSRLAIKLVILVFVGNASCTCFKFMLYSGNHVLDIILDDRTGQNSLTCEVQFCCHDFFCSNRYT